MAFCSQFMLCEQKWSLQRSGPSSSTQRKRSTQTLKMFARRLNVRLIVCREQTRYAYMLQSKTPLVHLVPQFISDMFLKWFNLKMPKQVCARDVTCTLNYLCQELKCWIFMNQFFIHMSNISGFMLSVVYDWPAGRHLAWQKLYHQTLHTSFQLNSFIPVYRRDWLLLF